MEAILLKDNLSTADIIGLIQKGIMDMDIQQQQRDEIVEAADTLAKTFANTIQFHMANGENPDASYRFQISVHFNNFIEKYRQVFISNYKKDVLVGFGISAIWMGILNGLDAESGIMPNHPFKREIANCLRTINEILDNKA
ncbi:hypothetical protein [Ancylomarina longa]|uniref:Uncharacterized protein n=1 Tax=Ancylomarina longa TaxID=2487017 RepID=A0A434AH43_9BACT|nr:hypothetical protein [Ancylomarina longa]RUT73643.1 hypothetical protein DLK05_12520 [Ancylomarina longa]